MTRKNRYYRLKRWKGGRRAEPARLPRQGKEKLREEKKKRGRVPPPHEKSRCAGKHRKSHRKSLSRAGEGKRRKALRCRRIKKERRPPATRGGGGGEKEKSAVASPPAGHQKKRPQFPSWGGWWGEGGRGDSTNYRILIKWVPTKRESAFYRGEKEKKLATRKGN